MGVTKAGRWPKLSFRCPHIKIWPSGYERLKEMKEETKSFNQCLKGVCLLVLPFSSDGQFLAVAIWCRVGHLVILAFGGER
jgi:hypothetical protein